ncbi:MAG: DNA polymerase III subunit beta [Dethiobacteria bacterium]|jgi:DNA polymerase-3 subunit beta
MQLLLHKNKLMENLSLLEKIIPSRTPITFLQGIKLETTAEHLLLTTSSMDMTLKTYCPAKVSQLGSVILPAKFFDIIRQAPAEEIEINLDEDELRVAIRSGTANFSLYGTDAEQFPKLTAEQEWQQWTNLHFSAPEMMAILRQVLFAVSQDENKPSFRGILLEADAQGQLLCLSSDTYRLACFEKFFGQNNAVQPFRLLIPGKSLNEIARILGDSQEIVACYFQKNEIIFVHKQFVFSSRLLEDKYPELLTAFPQGYVTKIVLPAELLEKTVGRAALLAQGENRMIALEVRGKTLQVRSNSEIGKMAEEIRLTAKEGDDLDEILVNSRFFLDVLRIWGEESVEVQFNGPLGPCIFQHRQEKEDSWENYRYLVLPIKPD